MHTKNARMNIRYFFLTLFNLKIFGETVKPKLLCIVVKQIPFPRIVNLLLFRFSIHLSNGHSNICIMQN